MIHKIIEGFKQDGFKKYLKNTSWLFLGKIGGMVISFFVTAYMIRYLGPDNYGILSYAISFTGLFSFLSSLGIDSILYRDLVNRPEDQRKLMGTSFGLKIIGSFLSIVVLLIFLPFMHNNQITNGLIIILALTFFLQSFNIFNFFFQAKLLSKNVTIAYLAGLIILSLLKLLVIWLNEGLLYFGLVLFSEPFIYALFYIYIYKRLNFSIREWEFDRTIAKTMLSSSWPLIISSAFALICSRIDQVIIKQMMNIETVGLYDAAVRVAEIWYFIPGIVISSIFPAIVNAKKTGQELYRSRLIKLAVFTFLGSMAFAFPIYLLAPWIVSILYGSAYLQAIPVLRIYVWAGIGATLGAVVNNYLIVEDKTKISFLINFFAMTLNIILNIYWIPKMGMNGAALATLVSYSMIPIFGILLNFKNIIIWKKMILSQ